MRIADVTKDSVTEGPGLRMVIWVQGCHHHCKGCHNPQTWDPTGGKEISVTNLCTQALMYGGNITFCGGEPFDQYDELLLMCKGLEGKKNIWCYTGFTIEEILNSDKKEILRYIDVLAEGRFILELKTSDSIFRGSSNQRLIDCKKTYELGVPVEYEC